MGDGHQAFQRHLLKQGVMIVKSTQAIGDRQVEQVGKADPVNGGNEGDGNAGTESGGLLQKKWLAPAAALNWTSQLVRALNAFGEDFLVPSASNATYRASCEGTSMAAYNALFDSLRATQESGLGKSKAPTLVLIDPKDELVSGPGLAELIEFNALNEWRLEQVSNRGATLERGAYHHLIIDEPSVGSEEWKRIQTLIRKHLEPMGTSGSLKP